MSFEVRLAARAQRSLRRLDPQVRQRIEQRLAEIGDDPFAGHSRPLTDAEGQWSSRVGDWRIIFFINHDDRVIEVRSIRSRGDVYRRM
jgi:mRNA interferase RelE/StbE